MNQITVYYTIPSKYLIIQREFKRCRQGECLKLIVILYRKYST
ncbi:protein of unknown function [Shewanella benthica]|uniref:Uncharacterized protein n=1 Tax=Shewanella benthica TaxID=43661 RepID=A0A330M4K0_9GAMM|nr:protein of unknown function [Shewanella benthica]